MPYTYISIRFGPVENYKLITLRVINVTQETGIYFCENTFFCSQRLLLLSIRSLGGMWIVDYKAKREQEM